ncbi:uncharacterized protein PODANS_7_10740 [Podospora anserina S mat+]|uniref:Podospora anserina S mat+ genomic DNA chromosome 7, supercontig 1 n=1 Tax=Podospora anserina (strain S / ATCC MYA-4624 / DSM 980 / FGSC 10383) TaxID=515849 RepID=B2AXJ1_PODAN|nr:uncharacterized protein PODANS_7_10740 [Podospora anserina S mat+]CAP69115.1 unnamed protein product [Podospora anserina S mat+]
MVYCGKPSKGCSNCRDRKIRCDQRAPGCGQCEKRHQTCPGYRNLVDLMFRDESSHVIKKAKARARKKGNLIVEPSTPSGSEGRLSVTPEPRGKPSVTIAVPATPAPTSPADSDAWGFDDSLLMSPESGSWPTTPPAMALYNIPAVCQEHGFAFFFSRFVTAHETACHQKFDFVREVWKPSRTKRERQVDSVLASLTAVGLMGMASLQRRNDLMDAARKSYGVALGLTKDALKDPAEAVKDSTMLSILILGVFEMMAESPARARTVTAFQEHVNGAAALARIRGPAQFQTRAGRRMFSMLCQRVVISCAMKDMPMPQHLKELWHEMAKTLEPEDPTRHETGIKQADALVNLIVDEGGVGGVDWIDPTLEQTMGGDGLLLSPDMLSHDGWGNGGGLYGLGLSPLQVPMEYMGDDLGVGVGGGDLVWV